MTSRQGDNEFAGSQAAALVERTLSEGFEQGCWFSAEDAQRFVVSEDEADGLADRWERLDEADRLRLATLEATTLPGRAQDAAPDDRNDRYLILTQQCDLVREPAVEPTFETVFASWNTDANRIGAGRSLRSWRELVVADAAGGTRAALIADTRRRALVDKRALFTFAARQALPDLADARRRFAYWAGARYYRRPVPYHLSERVERPLRNAIRKNAAMRLLAQEFAMFVVEDRGESVRLYAIYEREEDGDELERRLDELCAELEGLSPDDCEVRHIAQSPMTWVFAGGTYLLDLESYSGADEPRPPALTGET